MGKQNEKYITYFEDDSEAFAYPTDHLVYKF